MDSPSIRSLSSLLLLPPPKQILEQCPEPPAPPGSVGESRDDDESERQASTPHDEYCARDGAAYMGRRKKSSTADATGVIAPPSKTAGTAHRKTPEKKESNSIVKSKSDTIGSNEFDQSSMPQLCSSGNSNQYIFMVGTTKCYSRTLIPPTIYHNTSTDLWVVTINNNNITNSINYATNANNNTIKAFSFRSEKEARASAYANAPPVMLAFDQWKQCMLCNSKFTMFKRPRHCRNCGICICSNFGCCARWPRTMIPETFNIKMEKTVKVCSSCDTLAKRFQHALLQGQYKIAVDLYLTGNINLRVPFAFRGRGNAEVSFPLHCAIEGMSESLVRWLVDVQHCPIHVISTGNNKRGGILSVAGIKSLALANEQHHDFIPTLKTSKGRSVLDVAMKTQHVGILKYLINEKSVCVYEVEDLELALGAVEALSKADMAVDPSQEPKSVDVNKSSNGGNGAETIKSNTEYIELIKSRTMLGSQVVDTSPKKAKVRSHTSPQTEKTNYAGLYASIGGYHGNVDSDDEEEEANESSGDENSVCTTIPDVCIMCCQRDVNCVATPCGHQICCLTCSRQRITCPKCNTNCHFIDIFQP